MSKQEIKRLDRDFQTSGERFWCQVGLSPQMAGHWAPETAWHHLKGRRHMDTRYDEGACVRLCHHHHRLWHDFGEDRFYERYFFSALPPEDLMPKPKELSLSEYIALR